MRDWDVFWDKVISLVLAIGIASICVLFGTGVFVGKQDTINKFKNGEYRTTPHITYVNTDDTTYVPLDTIWHITTNH